MRIALHTYCGRIFGTSNNAGTAMGSFVAGSMQTARLASVVALVVLVSFLLVSLPVLALDGKTTAAPLTPTEALRAGVHHYNAGQKTEALNALQYAAENGQPGAAWKLGEMFANGDGVPEDDKRAFEYYSQIVREHGDAWYGNRIAAYVGSAFTALGKYYRSGIDGVVPRNEERARDYFATAANVYHDAEAQYQLGRIYQDANHMLAVRWYNLAAKKGHNGARARLGEALFVIAQDPGRKARALMWITIARENAAGADAGWIGDIHEQYFALADEDIRRLARGLADEWTARYGQDFLSAQQIPVQ